MCGNASGLCHSSSAHPKNNKRASKSRQQTREAMLPSTTLEVEGVAHPTNITHELKKGQQQPRENDAPDHDDRGGGVDTKHLG